MYRGDRFWRYNETVKIMDPGYPKHIGRWRGVPENLDAATTWKDGNRKNVSKRFIVAMFGPVVQLTNLPKINFCSNHLQRLITDLQ